MNRPAKDVVLLVADAVALVFGWTVLANIEPLALSVLGCGYQLAPNPDGSLGGCLGTTLAERVLVQGIGAALAVSGAVAILIGAVKYRIR